MVTVLGLELAADLGSFGFKGMSWNSNNPRCCGELCLNVGVEIVAGAVRSGALSE